MVIVNVQLLRHVLQQLVLGAFVQAFSLVVEEDKVVLVALVR